MAEKINLAKILRAKSAFSQEEKANYRKKFRELIDFFDYSKSQKFPPEGFSHLVKGYPEEEKQFLLELSKLFLNSSDKYQTIFETSLSPTDTMKEISLSYGVYLVEGRYHNYISVSKGLFDD